MEFYRTAGTLLILILWSFSMFFFVILKHIYIDVTFWGFSFLVIIVIYYDVFFFINIVVIPWLLQCGDIYNTLLIIILPYTWHAVNNWQFELGIPELSTIMISVEYWWLFVLHYVPTLEATVNMLFPVILIVPCGAVLSLSQMVSLILYHTALLWWQ